MNITKNPIKITFRKNKQHIPIGDFEPGSIGVTRNITGDVKEILMHVKLEWANGAFALDLRTGIIGEFPPSMPLEPVEAEVMLRDV